MDQLFNRRKSGIAIRVESGPNASDEIVLRDIAVTVGSGQMDTIRVFDDGVKEAQLRIFPHLDDTDPEAEPTGWGFAYLPGVRIANSADNARFGDVRPGLTFDVGGTRLRAVAAAEPGAAKPVSALREPSLPVAIAIILCAALALGGWFYWQASLANAPSRESTKLYLSYARHLQQPEPRPLPGLADCLAAPLALSAEAQADVVPGSKGYAFLALRRAPENSAQEQELRQAFLTRLRTHFQRAALFDETDNASAIRAELQSVVDLIPVSLENCVIVENVLKDISRLKD